MASIEEDPCLATNGYGVDYREFSCVYPALEPFYFEFEKKYDPASVLEQMRISNDIPVIACILYGVLIWCGQSYFKNRDRLNWRYTLAAWNLFLCVFSTIGASRTVPNLLHNLLYLSPNENVCGDPRANYGSGSTGLWVQLFVLSKFPELFDTFFIVIHKKKLIFLHWYHHITVLLYCWHSYVTMSPPGIFFVAMNYSVHAVMYGYYFLMAIKCRPKWFNPMVITTFQISQMVVGVAVTLLGFHYYNTDSSCLLQGQNNMAAFIMYGSYLLLFLQFFIGRYVEPKVTITPHKKKKVV